MGSSQHTDSLVDAHEQRRFVTLRTHAGEMIEYAEVIDFPTPKSGPATVRIVAYRKLSGARFTPRGRRKTLTLHTIASVEVRDDPVPSDPAEAEGAS